MTLCHPEPISLEHQLDGFRCGEPDLDDWLKEHALTSHRAESARTYVTHEERVVRGFYSLSSGSVRPAEATKRVATGIGEYDVPIAVLARLAVDVNYQRQGVGRSLLRDALLRVAGAADEIGIRALLVHVKRPDLKGYYAQFGFEQSPTDDDKMLLLMKDLRKAIAG